MHRDNKRKSPIRFKMSIQSFNLIQQEYKELTRFRFNINFILFIEIFAARNRNSPRCDTLTNVLLHVREAGRGWPWASPF